MPIGTPVSLGTPVFDTENDTTSIAMTITAAADSTLMIGVSWYNLVSLTSVTVGALTATLPSGAQRDGTVDTSRHAALLYVYTAASITAQTLTATFSGAAFGRAIAGIYVPGVASASPVDGTSVSAGGTGTSWSPGSVTLANSDSVLVSFSWFDGPITNNTPVTGVEAVDFDNALNAGWNVMYRLPGAAGAQSIAGTWTNGSGGATLEWLSVMSGFKAAGGVVTVSPGFSPSRMPLGV